VKELNWEGRGRREQDHLIGLAKRGLSHADFCRLGPEGCRLMEEKGSWKSMGRFFTEKNEHG